MLGDGQNSGSEMVLVEGSGMKVRCSGSVVTVVFVRDRVLDIK